jgi:cell volume regulation protein A
VELKAWDLIVLGGEKHFDLTGHDLTEFTIPPGHKWADHTVKELSLPPDSLVVMAQRDNGEIIVPLGDTLLKVGDKVIMLKVEQAAPPKARPFRLRKQG